MNRKWIYVCSLIGFFVLWGLFSSVSVPSRNHTVEPTAVVRPGHVQTIPQATEQPAIPVTGDPRMETEVLLIYGFMGAVALFIILALLNAANKPGTTSARPKEPPDESA